MDLRELRFGIKRKRTESEIRMEETGFGFRGEEERALLEFD